MSQDHSLPQVISFKDASNDGAKTSDLGRELFSYPRPEDKESMADYIKSHTEGDIFPYVSVIGREEETRDGRLSRLRAFTSPYGKSVMPEMRINGVVLDMLVGNMRVGDLKEHVNQTRLSRAEKRVNGKFRGIDEHVFKKPYIQLSRITGEFVPLISGSADYTELVFSLRDERLLDNQTIAQSVSIPTNSSGIIEMSCDYCIPTKDIGQLSIRYELARPIMKEDFQWGSISLVISVSESDTPYVTPKIEAMAVVRAPYTTLEDRKTDPDHKDVLYTSSQIRQFREMYRSGDIADNDEPLKEKLKKSSYSKSTIRGVTKAIKGPEHLGGMEGWSQLEGMRKPLIDEALASVSAISDEDEPTKEEENEQEKRLDLSKKEWERQQEELRKQFEEQPNNIVVKPARMIPSVLKDYTKGGMKMTNDLMKRMKEGDASMVEDSDSTESINRRAFSETDDDSEPEIMKEMRKRRVGFSVQGV